MTISDVIFDTIADVIDGCVHYYDQHELLDMADDDDIAEVIAAHLKVDTRRSFWRPTEEELARIEAINWKEKAKKHIRQYLIEHFLSDKEDSSEEESEDEKIKPYVCTIGVVKK